MTGLGLTWALALMGCEEPVSLDAVTEELDLFDPKRILVGSDIGVGRVEIPLRVVNDYEATVPGKNFEIEVTGESLASFNAEIKPDALGYASLVLESEQAQELEVLVVATYGNAIVGHKAPSWITGSELHPLPLHEAYEVEDTVDFVQRATGGVAYAVDNKVFYQRVDVAVPPQKIMAVPDEVVGLTAVDLDRDGYLDLVVWTPTRVVLLRGRGLQGYGWSMGFTTPGARLRGVDVADFDGDNLPDMAIGFEMVDGTGAGAQVLVQDGFGSWDALPPLHRTLEVADVALGDFQGEGLSELVLLTADGPIRYGYDTDWVEAERAWNRIDPDLAWALETGSVLLPSRDLDGDANPELIGVGTAGGDEDEQTLSFYTIGESAVRFDLGFPDFQADVFDITGDGVDDICVLFPDGEGGQLRTVTTDADDGNFKNRGLASLALTGPMAVGDLDDDGDSDVVVGGNRIWVHKGAHETGGWSVDDGEPVTFGLSLAGPVYFDDWDQDGRANVLAIREVSDGVVVQHYEVAVDATGGGTVLQAYLDGQVLVDTHDRTVKARGLDIAVCDDEHVYVLLEDGETVAWRLNRSSTGALSAKASGAVNGTALACGDLVSGALVAVVNEAGDVIETDGKFVTVATNNIGTPAYDVVVADVDGTGPTAQVCSSPGCSLAVLDLDGDGLDELLEGGTDARLIQASGDTALGTSGLAGVTDLDGDGFPDGVLTDTATGSVALHRFVGGSLLPVWWLHTRLGVEGPVHFVDVDSDGVPELWFIGEEGTLVHTMPSTQKPVEEGEETETPDSADTGADTGS